MQFVKVAAHVLIQKDNKYLVIKRSPNDVYKPNLWDTPGGIIKFGEKIIDALVRETKEESGLTVKVGNVIFCNDFVNGNRHQFDLVYLCEYIDGDVKLNLKEHTEFKWVDLEELESLEKITFLEALFKFLKNSN